MPIHSTAIYLAIALIHPIAQRPLWGTAIPNRLNLHEPNLVRANPTRTVTDYFLQAPNRYFKILDSDRDRVTPTIRRKLLTELREFPFLA